MKCVSFIFGLIVFSCTLLHGQNKLSDLQSPFSKYSVSTTECSKIMHHSGSLIFIPSEAFAVDVTQIDFVTILYREVRTPVQILIHNIKMTTELMGKSYYLQSNGMFEMYCVNDKDTIQVHEDRSIVVRLAMQSDEMDVRMEGFRYDYQNAKWDSYTNRIQNLFLNEKDDDQWGSGIVQSIENVESVGQGWEDEWVLDSAWERQDSLRNLAFQTMEVFDFGLYNYDKIIDDEVFVSYIPQFVDQGSAPIKTDIYVVYEGLNTVIYFSDYKWKEEFTLIKDRKYSLFTVNEEGAVLKLNKFPDLSSAESEVTFILEENGKLPNSADELSNLIGVK